MQTATLSPHLGVSAVNPAEFTMDLETSFSILRGKKSWFFHADDLDARLKACEQIRENRDWKVIWRLVPFLRDKNREIQLASSDVISSLLETRTSKNLFYDSLKYCDISVSDIDYFRSSFGADQYLNLLIIASSNLSGYVREKAVYELGLSNNDKAIPFVLYRLGDWVPQVRTAALNAIENFKSAGHTNGLVENLPIIDLLQRVERVDLSSTRVSLMNYIVEASGRESRENFKLYPEKGRTLLAKHISNSTNISDGDLQLFFSDPNPIIRGLAIDHLEKLSDEEIKKLLNDKSSKVRLHILRKLLARNDFVEIVRPFLSDSAASIRAFARFYLRGESIDFAAFYADKLENKCAIASSLAGLAEVDGRVYSHLLEEYLDNAQAKIAKTAFVALTKLNETRAYEIALANLDNEMRAVRKAAARFLARRATPETFNRAREIYRLGRFELKVELLTMFNNIGRWEAIQDILLATIDENKDIRDLAVKYLNSWKMKAANLFIRPNSATLERNGKIAKFVFDEHERRQFFETNPTEGFEFYLK